MSKMFKGGLCCGAGKSCMAGFILDSDDGLGYGTWQEGRGDPSGLWEAPLTLVS